MSDQIKLSQHPANKKKSKWRFVFWLFAIVSAALLFAAFLVWKNLNSVVEWQVRRELAKIGMVAELEIDSISGQSTVIKNIILSANGAAFFRSSKIILEYDAKQLRSGQLKKMTIQNMAIQLELNGQGKIINEWMPKSSAQSLSLPSGGVVVEDAKVGWSAPFGQGDVFVNADVKSLHSWTFQVDSQTTTLRHDDVSVIIGYQGVATQKSKNLFSAIGSVSTQGLDTPALGSGLAKTNFNLEFKRGMVETLYGIEGQIDIDGQDISSTDYAALSASLRLAMNGQFNMETARLENLNTLWQFDALGAKVRNREKRQGLARQLSASDILEKTPLVGVFSDSFPEDLSQLMQNFAAQGSGNFVSTSQGYWVLLDDDLMITSPEQSISIRSDRGKFLTFDKPRQELALQANVDLNGKRPLKISALNMSAKSMDGLTLTEITGFKAKIKSQGVWEAVGNNLPHRLAPFNVDFKYALKNKSRNAIIIGDIDYDGAVPGGAVKGLIIGGVLSVVSDDNVLNLGLNASGKARIEEFKSASGWRAKDLKFSIKNTENFYVVSKDSAELQADLLGVRAQIISPENNRHLGTQFKQLSIHALLMGYPQKWDIEILGANITSDDFPSPGTKIYSSASSAHVEVAKNGDMKFQSINPNTSIETDNIRVKNIAIDLMGAPDNFTAKYAAQQVEMIGDVLPVLPMRGEARMQKGKLTGNASTNLPMTNDTPITIDFTSVDGRGTANISIPSIMFDPNGLQPQYLVPSLKGKLADVTGTVSAQFAFSFGGGKPLRSSGTTNLTDLDIGTLVGPLSGINSKLVFSSIFPLKTQGVQSATLSGFDPGFPLEGGQVSFEIVPGGVRIDEAIWPVKNIGSVAGSISLAPMEWRFGNVENRAIVHVENVELGTLLAKIGKEKFSATGQVSGTLPAVIKGVNVIVEEGVLAVQNGGVIQFKSSATDAASARSENAGLAFQALENFTYQKMEMRINGPIDGEMSLAMLFDGKNPDVLEGQAFLFDVVIDGELANIARNLTKAFGSQSSLEHILAAQSGETKP